jgi:phosphoribosyl-AMP cyclohydrolase
MKRESSGNTQQVKDVAYDCDGDTLMIQMDPEELYGKKS